MAQPTQSFASWRGALVRVVQVTRPGGLPVPSPFPCPPCAFILQDGWLSQQKEISFYFATNWDTPGLPYWTLSSLGLAMVICVSQYLAWQLAQNCFSVMFADLKQGMGGGQRPFLCLSLCTRR